LRTVLLAASTGSRCPSPTGWLAPVSAGEYSKLAGLLAGFAFTAIVFILREDVRTAFARSVEALIYAFFSLVLTSVNYAIMAGEDPHKAGGRVVSEGLLAGVAFAVSGLLLVYAIILLLDATDVARGAPTELTSHSERPFGRLARHLSAITALLLIPLLVYLVGPTGVQSYVDVTRDNSVKTTAWYAFGVQGFVSAAVGVALWTARRPNRTLRDVVARKFRQGRRLLRVRSPSYNQTVFWYCLVRSSRCSQLG
jgi:hypothetical protein